MKLNYLKIYIKEESHRILEMFDKSLPNINKISPTKYIVDNDNDIEAEFSFRKIDLDSNKWTISWSFTENNQNTSPEAWKQVTASSYKVLSDFINTKQPQSIEISGNTDVKTNIYKSPSFVSKLQDLFNNQYNIDNSDDSKIVMNLIESIRQSSIKKRMETMNESYEQSLNYWKHGDIYSKSKIERVNAIKKIVKRNIVEYLYKI